MAMPIGGHVPVPAPATFTSVFADASRDPTGGNAVLLLDPFAFDLANGNNNTTDDELRNAMASLGTDVNF